MNKIQSEFRISVKYIFYGITVKESRDKIKTAVLGKTICYKWV